MNQEKTKKKKDYRAIILYDLKKVPSQLSNLPQDYIHFSKSTYIVHYKESGSLIKSLEKDKKAIDAIEYENQSIFRLPGESVSDALVICFQPLQIFEK